MAIKTVKIEDETMAKYELMDPKNPLKALTDQLKRFEDFPTTKRVTILRDDVREAIERIYGSAIEDQDGFLAWVKRLSECGLENVRIPLTEGQRKRLQAESLHRHRTIDELLNEKLKWALTSVLGW